MQAMLGRAWAWQAHAEPGGGRRRGAHMGGRGRMGRDAEGGGRESAVLVWADAIARLNGDRGMPPALHVDAGDSSACGIGAFGAKLAP